MKLNRTKIFGLLTLFILIANLVVSFNIQVFYIRAILGFIFLTGIPGLFIMLALKVDKINIWEYLCYVIGLSITVLIFGGLIINWLLPILGNKTPLSLPTLQLGMNIIIAGIGMFAYIRNKNLTIEIQNFRFRLPDSLLYLTSMMMPVLGSFGAITLNNGSTNVLALFNYSIICLFLGFVYFYRKRFGNNIYPVFILMASVSILLSGWLRSQYISGSDINHEYQVFQLAKQNQLWEVSDYYNAYNSCLSINILPVVLSSFVNIDDQYIFKLIIPLLFSITPVIIYLLSKKYLTEPFSLLAAFFFVSQPTFTNWALIPTRQEVAFIFFSLSILVLVSKNLKSQTRWLLLVLFNVSMIVSHYSTAYIAISIYILMYLFNKILQVVRRNDVLFYINTIRMPLSILLLILVFTYIWYAKITYGFENVVDFANSGVKNISKIFTNDVQAQGQSVFDQLNIFRPKRTGPSILDKYVRDMTVLYKANSDPNAFYENNLEPQYKIDYAPLEISSKTNLQLANYFNILRNLLKILGELLVVLGTLYYVFAKKIKYHEATLLNLSALAVLLGAIVTPFISINYDLVRTYQQILVILSFTVVSGILAIKYILRTPKIDRIIFLFFILYLAFLSRYSQQLIGGVDVSMVFNSKGLEYSKYYTHKTDIVSGKWLSGKTMPNDYIFADEYANTKLRLTNTPKFQSHVLTIVLPTTITKSSYVYLNYANVVDQIAFATYLGDTLTYSYPSRFLQNNKNLIYNNGKSEIFK